MKNKSLFIIVLFAMMVPLTVCQAGASEEKMPVFVSILPQKYFVEKIGGSLVEVNVMVPPGSDPHTYEPKPMQMKKLASAKIFFAIGINFEDTWLKKITASSSLKTVHTDAGIQKIAMTEEKSDHHGEEQRGGHNHDSGGLDPHIWLSPRLVMKQAETIKNALIEADPANASEYDKGCLAFIEEIKTLDGDLKAIFEKTEKKKFIVSHPAWGYFADEYNLEQIPIEIDGKEPKPAQIKEMIRTSKKLGIKVIFAQPQFSRQIANVLAREIGGNVLLADDLAENWNENLRLVAEKFKKELR